MYLHFWNLLPSGHPLQLRTLWGALQKVPRLRTPLNYLCFFVISKEGCSHHRNKAICRVDISPSRVGRGRNPAQATNVTPQDFLKGETSFLKRPQFCSWCMAVSNLSVDGRLEYWDDNLVGQLLTSILATLRKWSSHTESRCTLRYQRGFLDISLTKQLQGIFLNGPIMFRTEMIEGYRANLRLSQMKDFMEDHLGWPSWHFSFRFWTGGGLKKSPCML